MPGSGRKYGVQVGNETYSLIMTQDDWEKRRLDREHARKLSLATNKRRRALDDRKKLAEMRENRKIELELFKRRQRQIEATERYQRFHINVKDRRDRNSEMTHATPNLELILQKLRGGDGDATTASAAYEFLPPPLHETKHSSSDVESKHERAKWQTMKDYSTEFNRDILEMKHMEGEANLKKDSYLNEDNDGQDSLHGSTVSGSSSQPSLSSFNCAKDVKNTVNNNRFPQKTQQALEEEAAIARSYKDSTSQQNVQEKQFATDMRVPDASGNLIPTSESGVLCKRDTQTGRITYYVKAYRPWSAGMTNKPQQNIFNRPTEPLRIRPSSSYETRRPVSNNTSENPQKQYDTSTTNSGFMVHTKQPTVPNQHRPVISHHRVTTAAATSYIDIKPTQTRALILGKTTATPVSPFFDGAQKESDNIASSPITSSANSVSSAHTRQTIRNESVTSNTDSNSKQIQSVSSSESNSSDNNKKDGALKGILRRHSKYETSPIPQYIYPQHSYQSAGLARQNWLHGINFGPPRTNSSDTNREVRARSAETKSVRWHQVQYNDGTSSALDVHNILNIVPSPPIVAPKPTPVIVTPARGVKAAKKSTQNRPKTSPARSTRGGKGKGGNGRKLRVAKDVPVNIKPHPPKKASPKLSMSTVINYSIDPSEDTKSSSPTTNKFNIHHRHANGSKRASPITHNKILFHRKVRADSDAVTMSTLKSSSGSEMQTNGTNDIGNVVVNQGNQVTISVSSSRPINYGSNNTRRSSADGTNRIPLNGTPTDQEIDMLWDKVRAYLAWNRNHNTPAATKKYRSHEERKVAWGSAQPEQSAKHISANIISIDGGIFSKNTHSDDNSESQNKQSQQIAAQMDRYGITKSRKVANSFSSPMQVYDWNNSVSPYQKHERTRGTIPIVKNGHPSSAPVRRQAQLTESVKTFRLVEALIEQNVPEEQILRALNSLQTATREV